MKKNILLVQSFLILPLLTSSFIFSAEKISYVQAAGKGTQLPLTPAQRSSLKNSGSQKRAQRKKQLPDKQATIIVSTPVEKPVLDNVETPVIETPVVTAEQFDIPNTPLLASSDEKVAPQESVSPKAPSKYLITELSPENQAHAQEDLQKAKSYQTKDLIELLSVIKSINPDDHGLTDAQHIASITQELPAPAKEILIQLSEDLEKSVMSPVEKQGFGFGDKLWNAFSTYRSTIIKLLVNETFEPTNADHKEYFNQALAECASYQDMQSLEQILILCKKEKYESLQSAINHVAPAFNYISKDFAASITASNKALVTHNQECAMEMNRASVELQENLTRLLNGHRDKVTAIAQSYNNRVDSEQKNYDHKKTIVAAISGLNAKVKESENALLFEYPLQTPTNAVAAIENQTHTNIRYLMTHKNMPQAKLLQL